MLVEIVKAEQAHAVFVAGRMRMADKLEVWARWRHDPLQAALVSFESSTLCWAGLVDGEPVALFGVAEIAPGIGSPGLLGTDGLERVPLIFARQSRAYVRQMLDLYPVLLNEVHADNAVSLRWLEWLGFEIVRKPRIYNNEKFFLFRKVRHV